MIKPDSKFKIVTKRDNELNKFIAIIEREQEKGNQKLRAILKNNRHD